MENLIDFYGHKIPNGSGKALSLFEKYGRKDFRVCFYRKVPKEKTVECYCPTTDSFFEISYAKLGKKKMKEFVCPFESSCEKCGCKFYNANYPHKGLNKSESVGYFERCADGVVFRGYYVTIDFSAEYQAGQFDESGGYPLRRRGDLSVNEVSLVFYGEKGSVENYSKLYRGYFGMYTYVGKFRKRKNCFQGDCFEYLGDVKSDLNGTILEGVVKYAEKFNDAYSNRYFDSFVDLYAMLWKYAGIRRLIEYGFMGCARDYVSNVLHVGRSKVDGFNMKSNSIKGVIGVEPNVFNDLDKMTLSLHSVRDLATVYKNYGIYPTKENSEMVLHYGFCKIAEKTGDVVTVRKILKYVRAQKRRNSNADFGIYYDYIVTAEKVNFDIKSKEVLFPKDLMRAHDRVIGYYKVVGNVVKRKDFMTAIKNYANYSYEDEEKYVDLITEPNLLALWAKKFHNCSYGYCDRIINGKCVIFLVRLKAFPEYPFCMFELETGSCRVVQARDRHNHKVSKYIEDFIYGFVDEMKLRVKYAEH